MAGAALEHVNVTVSDPLKTAEFLCDLFGWHIRWQGEAKDNGYTVHVGGDDSYVAVYRPSKPLNSGDINTYVTRGGLNHIGVVVDDLDRVEAKVVAAGYKPHSHADYQPGRRFYFYGDDNVEIEVVSYKAAPT